MSDKFNNPEARLSLSERNNKFYKFNNLDLKELKDVLKYSRSVNAHDLIKILDISIGTLYGWIKNGKFPEPDFRTSRGNIHLTSVRQWSKEIIMGWITENDKL